MATSLELTCDEANCNVRFCCACGLCVFDPCVIARWCGRDAVPSAAAARHRRQEVLHTEPHGRAEVRRALVTLFFSSVLFNPLQGGSDSGKCLSDAKTDSYRRKKFKHTHTVTGGGSTVDCSGHRSLQDLCGRRN